MHRLHVVEEVEEEEGQASTGDSSPWIKLGRDERPFWALDRATSTPKWFHLPGRAKSLMVGLLSVGTCVGSLLGSDVAGYLGRKTALLIGCVVFTLGIVDQIASVNMDLLGRGRFETGLGMGTISTVIILYMSEISPAPIRGFVVAFYQFCMTLGLLIAACANYGTRAIWNMTSFRIPISLQLVWAVALVVGLVFLPESPRWYVKMGKLEMAQVALEKLRCRPKEDDMIHAELQNMVRNHEHEMEMVNHRKEVDSATDTYWASWADCFRGPWRERSSNFGRTLLGSSIQMFQQVTGVNFIFYFGTAFLKEQGFDNVFVILVAMNAVSVASTIASFYLVTKLRRRHSCVPARRRRRGQYWRATAGSKANNFGDMPPWHFWTIISGIGVYLFCYATTWGPGAWVLMGEIFPLQIRARGVGLSTATNWLWNTIICFITPVMVEKDQ
ncbi:general substrate transporter [Podospora didyma]|uniref:General substrate transporter n=1 Tax=Podospora didyma TaxID=330526 RepID=A0AAE0U406_9PEZI|nr:general substrate transporter [Podospora didyma]